MKYEYLLFDLDGTITDSGSGILNAVRYALEFYGIKETDDAKLNRFIGPPLKRSFMELYGFDEKKAMDAIMKYREYYGEKGIFENEVYEGIRELLKKLTEQGYKPVLATSKPEMFTFKIMEHFELDKYFCFMAGATANEKRTEKYEVIEYALSCAKADKAKSIMIGDRKHDIEGAIKNGIDSIGVLYGYGSESELKKAGATYIVKDVEELSKFFL